MKEEEKLNLFLETLNTFEESKDVKGLMGSFYSHFGSYYHLPVYLEAFKRMIESLEKMQTDEAIERLLDFVRYTGGTYSGDESIYALHALDRIGTEDILQELYAKFLKGLVGIDNEFFIFDFVTIVGKHNFDLLLDIFSSPEEDFYLTPKKYNEDVLHLKSYIINTFGIFKNPASIEPLVNALVDEFYSRYDSSIKEALVKINEPEETIGRLLEKYNYFTNLLHTLFGTVRWILRSLNVSIVFTDFSSFAEDIESKYYFIYKSTRLFRNMRTPFFLKIISYFDNNLD